MIIGGTRTNKQDASREDTVSVKGPLSRFALFAVLAMSCYQLLLCFIHTNIMPVSDAFLGAVEILILAAVFIKIGKKIGQIAQASLLAIFVYFCALYALRMEVNLFALRNIVIILAFFYMGKQVKSLRAADTIVKTVSALVLLFIGIEYFFTDLYLSYFNILDYNIARGSVGENASEFMDKDLAVNGIRFVGRTLLPFLGNQRVSSIFLEPVSMGNFATIIAIWFLSLDVKEWRKNFSFLVIAVTCVIACDSRFASISLFFLAAVRFIPLFHRRGIVAVMPVVVILFLVAFFFLQFGQPGEDNLTGRLASSGKALTEIDILSWFGFDNPRFLADMGVSYTIEHFGLILIAGLWLTFSFQKIENKRGRRFRALLAVYTLSLLMISGTSFYSAKTASLLWLLMGIMTSSLHESIDNKTHTMGRQ